VLGAIGLGEFVALVGAHAQWKPLDAIIAALRGLPRPIAAARRTLTFRIGSSTAVMLHWGETRKSRFF
jgi:hypothetical protein